MCNAIPLKPFKKKQIKNNEFSLKYDERQKPLLCKYPRSYVLLTSKIIFILIKTSTSLNGLNSSSQMSSLVRKIIHRFLNVPITEKETTWPCVSVILSAKTHKT